MKQRLLVAGSCLLAVAALAAGCGGSDSGGSGDDQGGTPAKTDEGDHKGGTLTMLWSAPGQSIDTAIAYDQNWQVLRMAGDGAARLEAGRRARRAPSSCPTSPSRSPSRPTAARPTRSRMREGIKFSTGETVKPSDIRYTIERNVQGRRAGQRVLREPRRRRRLREEAEGVRPVEGDPRRRRREHRHVQAHRARPRPAAEAGAAVRVRGAEGDAEQGHRHRPAARDRART